MGVRRQFCLNGHDTAIVGRAKSGRCIVCRLIAAQAFSLGNRRSRECQSPDRLAEIEAIKEALMGMHRQREIGVVIGAQPPCEFDSWRAAPHDAAWP